MNVSNLNACCDPVVLIGKFPCSDNYVHYLKDHIRNANSHSSLKIIKKCCTICERYRRIPIILPCGKCENCRRKKQNEWNTRIMVEKDCNCLSFFATYTINPQHYPLFIDQETGEEKDYMNTSLAHLFYKQMQLHFKRLRKAGLKFRYYCCAEFGSEHGRLHFHVIYFITNPEEFDSDVIAINLLNGDKLTPYDINTSGKKNKRNSRLQTPLESNFAKILEHYYSLGFVEKVCLCNAETARYVTKYVTKTYDDESADKCPFHRQSLGLGTQWINANADKIGKGEIPPIMPNNNHGDFSYYCLIPRYYRTKFIKAYGDYSEYCRINIDNALENFYQAFGFYSNIPDICYYKPDYNYDIFCKTREWSKKTEYKAICERADLFAEEHRLEGLSFDFSPTSVACQFGMVGYNDTISKWRVRVAQNSRKDTLHSVQGDSGRNIPPLLFEV